MHIGAAFLVKDYCVCMATPSLVKSESLTGGIPEGLQSGRTSRISTAT